MHTTHCVGLIGGSCIFRLPIYMYNYINKLYDTVSSHNTYDHLMYILEVQSILLHVMHVANVILVSTCTHIIYADYCPMYHNLEALTQQPHIPKLYCIP